jgi:hypothetical protein
MYTLFKKTRIVFLFIAFLIPLGVFSNTTTLNVAVDNAQCKDTLDNDGDTLIDFPADPQCASLNDNTEAPDTQCSDSVDNDSDSLIDFPADTGCADASDNDETNAVGGGGGGDSTPPGITTLSPADNATNVSTSTNLAIDFNETVTIQTGNIKLKKTSDGSTVQTIAITSSSVVLTANSHIAITLGTPLLESTSYYVELDSGIVNDTSGNTFGGLSGSGSWNFTTVSDAVAPQISNLASVPAISSAALSWKTNESAISSFFWGTTTSYGSGSGAEVFYSLDHTTTISGLTPNTLYYFSIEARDFAGNKTTVTDSFTTLSDNDTVPPANPSGFTAQGQASSILLSWTNPPDLDFSEVIIRRSTGGYPGNPNEGILTYQGALEEFTDTSVSSNVRYYYTIFAKDASLNYSSGAIFSAILNPTPQPTPPPPEETSPPPPISSGGGGTPTSTTSPSITPPIETVPPSQVSTGTPPIVVPRFPLAFRDFNFFETIFIPNKPSASEKKLTPDTKDELSINEQSEVKISLNTGKAPPGSTLFIASIKDPITGKTSSYLLNKNKLGDSYEAVVSLAQKGIYPLTVKVYNVYNELLGEVSGTMRVVSPQSSFLSFIPQTITDSISPSVEAISPLAVPIGVAVGVSQATLLAANIGSFYDLYLVFLKFLGLLTGLFRKKRPEPWGVVYDSVTKQPIDPAYVVVERMEEGEKRSAITDLDGRYGFFLPPGHYSLLANKTHYKFPSEKLIGKSHDELYDNLYFGSSFPLEENQIIRYNIPLDPVGFDWNEFAKNKDKIFSLYSRRQKLRVWVFNSLFYIGMVLSSYGTLLHPTKLNMSVLAVYGGIIVFQAFWKRKHKVTTLMNKATKQPIPFAIISVTVPGLGVLMKKIVSDELGRFYLLVPPGVYDVTVSEKQDDASYAVVWQKKNVSFKKGILDEDILV